MFPGPLRPLLFPDVLPEEGEDLVAALDPGEDGGAVAPADLLRCQVGAEDGLPAGHEPVVDDLVEGADHKGGGHLAAQVVHNEEVAV